MTAVCMLNICEPGCSKLVKFQKRTPCQHQRRPFKGGRLWIKQAHQGSTFS